MVEINGMVLLPLLEKEVKLRAIKYQDYINIRSEDRDMG